MQLEFFHPELTRFAFVIGIIVGILFYDRRYQLVGGIAVPAYLSFTLFLPIIAPAVVAVALATYLLTFWALPYLTRLSPAANFGALVLTSATLHLILDISLLQLGYVDPSSQLLRGIGYVVPGLIAHDFNRQGIRQTLRNMTLSTLIVMLVLLLIAYLLPTHGRTYYSIDIELYTIDLTMMPLLIFLSVVAWIGVSRYQNLRCGGFLGAGFVSLLILKPIELLVFFIVAITTLIIVRVLLLPRAILFGRRRFAAHILTGACLSWLVFRFLELVWDSPTLAVTTPSLTIVSVLLPGLLAHDFDRVGVGRTIAGVSLSVVFILSGTLLISVVWFNWEITIAAMCLLLFLMSSYLLFGIRLLRNTSASQEPSVGESK